MKCYHHCSMMHVHYKQTSFQNVAHWGILNPCEPCESRHSQNLMIADSQWDGNEQLMSPLTLFLLWSNKFDNIIKLWCCFCSGIILMIYCSALPALYAFHNFSTCMHGPVVAAWVVCDCSWHWLIWRSLLRSHMVCRHFLLILKLI